MTSLRVWHVCTPWNANLVDDELLKYAESDDLWFHVSELSSAHVYLRLQPGWSLSSLPEALLQDCCQLVKANSIEGSKLNNVRIVYTPVSNLRKENGFEIGQVAFHSTKQLRYTMVPKKLNEIVNRLNKTKEDRQVDFAADKLARQREEASRKRAEEAKTKSESQRAERQRREAEEMKCYGTVMKSDKMSTNKFDEQVDIQSYEEDFFG